MPSSPPGAGAGVRVALIDSGVNAQHPFFDAAGFTAPAGYPKAQRVAGGVRTDLPLATYTNNKVIVANVYPYPGNTTATPWGPGSLHGTHVAGIMAGNNGTWNYTSGPATFPLQFSGMAPGAYVMSYRLDGDSAEFLAAIEDVVADEADALNISLGHSRWLTTDPAHDPIRDALDAAVDAGVIVAASSGNAGANGDTSITGSWKLSPKVITVANSSHARVFSNAVTVTGPGTPPAALARPARRARQRARCRRSARPISGEYVVAPGGIGATQARPAPRSRPTSLTGKIALVARGTCTFDVKKAKRHGGRCRRDDRAQQRPGRPDRDGRLHRSRRSRRHGHPRRRSRARQLGEREPDAHGRLSRARSRGSPPGGRTWSPARAAAGRR